MIFVVINLVNYPEDTTYAVYFFGAYTILTSFSQIFRSIFKAFEIMEYEVASVVHSLHLKVIIIYFSISDFDNFT